MSTTTTKQDEYWRWARAASWARAQSFGPWAHGCERQEAERITLIHDWIRELGEDEAYRRGVEAGLLPDVALERATK
jgi:hypothetical protein